jgi:hypothetical protein
MELKCSAWLILGCFIHHKLKYTPESNQEGPYKLNNSPADVVKKLFELFQVQAETLHLIIGTQV